MSEKEHETSPLFSKSFIPSICASTQARLLTNHLQMAQERQKLINSLTLSENLVNFLRVSIISNEFTPGQKLSEIDLSSKFIISSAPIREAFRVLEKEHLVVVVPRKGCYVSNISVEDCRQLYEVRMMIECFAIDRIQLKQPKNLDQIRPSLISAEDTQIPADADSFQKFEFVKRIFRFHIELVKTAGNAELERLFDGIFPKLARYQYMYMYSYQPELVVRNKGEHQEIIDLILKADFESAKKALKSHITRYVQLIEKRISSMKKDEKSQTANRLPRIRWG